MRLSSWRVRIGASGEGVTVMFSVRMIVTVPSVILIRVRLSYPEKSNAGAIINWEKERVT